MTDTIFIKDLRGNAVFIIQMNRNYCKCGTEILEQKSDVRNQITDGFSTQIWTALLLI